MFRSFIWRFDNSTRLFRVNPLTAHGACEGAHAFGSNWRPRFLGRPLATFLRQDAGIGLILGSALGRGQAPVAASSMPRARINAIAHRTFFALLGTIFLAAVTAACGNGGAHESVVGPTTPGPSTSLTTPLIEMANSNSETVSTAALATGSTDVPLVSKSYCGFSADNPYPCCQNSKSQFGNCTGAAWQKAKEAGWGNGSPGSSGTGLPGSWGDARNWASAAQAAGYIVDPTPSPKSIGIANNGPSLKNHAAFVTAYTSTSVTTVDQQCGYNLQGGFFTASRPVTTFNAGYIRAPIPTVNVSLWSGSLSATNGGTLTVSRGMFGAPVTVNFGFSLLRSNVNKGPSTYRWTVGGATVSVAGTFSKSFSSPGTFPVSVTVTNGLGVSTTASATIVVR